MKSSIAFACSSVRAERFSLLIVFLSSVAMVDELQARVCICVCLTRTERSVVAGSWQRGPCSDSSVQLQSVQPSVPVAVKGGGK